MSGQLEEVRYTLAGQVPARRVAGAKPRVALRYQ